MITFTDESAVHTDSHDIESKSPNILEHAIDFLSAAQQNAVVTGITVRTRGGIHKLFNGKTCIDGAAGLLQNQLVTGDQGKGIIEVNLLFGDQTSTM